MANYYAIAAISTALQGLLTDARPQLEFSTAQIELLQVSDFQKPKPIEEGVSIMLYRVAVSATPRNLYPRLDPTGRRKLPPLPVDLHFLFTVWGRSAARQQRLLGWLMRTLEDTPTLNAELLNYYGGPDTIFDETETVTMIFDPLSLQDLTNVWDILKPNVQPSVAYIARQIALETVLEEQGGELVQARDFRVAKVIR
jgi:hypothetical protein